MLHSRKKCLFIRSILDIPPKTRSFYKAKGMEQFGLASKSSLRNYCDNIFSVKENTVIEYKIHIVLKLQLILISVKCQLLLASPEIDRVAYDSRVVEQSDIYIVTGS